MPHVNLTITPVGPVLQAFLWLSKPRQMAMAQIGNAIPQAVQLQMLIDTGASCTCVSQAAIDRLQLTPTGSTPVHTPSTKGTPVMQHTYDAQIMVPGMKPGILLCNVESLPVVGTDFTGQAIDGLIGRDLLASAVLVYNGPSGQYSLSF